MIFAVFDVLLAVNMCINYIFNARYSYRLDVRPSVCLPVRHSWYCVKTAQPIVKLSLLPGSPMILVF